MGAPFNLSGETDEFRYAKGSVLRAGAYSGSDLFRAGVNLRDGAGDFQKVIICDPVKTYTCARVLTERGHSGLKILS